MKLGKSGYGLSQGMIIHVSIQLEHICVDQSRIAKYVEGLNFNIKQIQKTDQINFNQLGMGVDGSLFLLLKNKWFLRCQELYKMTKEHGKGEEIKKN